MSSNTAWLIALCLSICVIIIAAAVGRTDLHMLASGAVSVAFALTAIREHHSLEAAGASKSAIGSATARNAGLVWAWGAISIAATYALILENRWPEWWHFFLGFAIAAIASIIFSNMLDRDATAGRVDDAVLKVGRALIIAQLIGVIAGIISMFVDGKFPRDPSYPDWAGCNIFFFGALAIAAISADALLTQRKS